MEPKVGHGDAVGDWVVENVARVQIAVDQIQPVHRLQRLQAAHCLSALSQVSKDNTTPRHAKQWNNMWCISAWFT